METFNIKPSKIVGIIKDEIKEAIIEGRISNNLKEAKVLMMKLAKKHNLLN
jgi:ribosomal protein L21